MVTSANLLHFFLEFLPPLVAGSASTGRENASPSTFLRAKRGCGSPCLQPLPSIEAVSCHSMIRRYSKHVGSRSWNKNPMQNPEFTKMARVLRRQSTHVYTLYLAPSHALCSIIFYTCWRRAARRLYKRVLRMCFGSRVKVATRFCNNLWADSNSKRLWEIQRIPLRLPPGSAAFGAPKYEGGVGQAATMLLVAWRRPHLVHFRFHWLCQRNVTPSICEAQQHSTYVEGAWPPPYGCNPTKGMLKFLTDIRCHWTRETVITTESSFKYGFL